MPKYVIFISVINFPLFLKLRTTALSNHGAQAVPGGPELPPLLLGPFQPRARYQKLGHFAQPYE